MIRTVRDLSIKSGSLPVNISKFINRTRMGLGRVLNWRLVIPSGHGAVLMGGIACRISSCDIGFHKIFDIKI